MEDLDKWIMGGWLEGGWVGGGRGREEGGTDHRCSV